MCGISGVFSPASGVDVDTLNDMNDSVSHRGPDDSGIFTDGPVGLAHRRLSIIDLKSGRQPISNEDGSAVVIFNGEIYNYRELRRSLASSGHVFETETDTEVIVHLYEEKGLDFVKELEGMFAFALWDSDQNRLLLARDRMGIKPLLIGSAGDTIAFGSEISSLLVSELPHGGLDHRALGEYFAFGYVPAPKTVFRNYSKVRPGEMVVITDSSVNRRTYYEPTKRAVPEDFQSATDRLHEYVFTAVRKRMQSDVPLGAFLSGGIDSSIVVGALATVSDDPINTFTVGFSNSRYDESWAAQEVADYHDTNHTKFAMSAQDLRDIIPDIVGTLGEPFADPSLLPTSIVSRETRRNVKVALSGDGADELFGGYNKYRAEYYSKYYRSFPRSLRSVVKTCLNGVDTSRSSRLHELLYNAQWVANRTNEPDTADRHFDLIRIIDSDEADSVRVTDPISVGRNSVRTQHEDLPEGAVQTDSLSQIQAVDLRYSLPNQMLQKVDLASMSHSLEVRVPFLDTTIVEFVESLPTKFKITATTRKRLLKESFEHLLPETILERGKQGFDMPIGDWLRRELRGDFTDTIRSANLGVIDDSSVMDVLEDHCRGDSHTRFLWSVYVYKKWAANMTDRGVFDEA